MKTIKISVKKRTDLGRNDTKKLRKEDNVPCVMYGGEKNVHFFAHENEFRHIIYTNQVYVVELDVEGTIYKAVMKDLQFHSVTDKVLHIDFVQVLDNKPTIVSLPVELTGVSEGILAGGKLRQRRKYLKVKGLVKDMPETLLIDITPLNIGDVVKVSGLSYPNLELLDPGQAMVVGVATSRLMSLPEDEIEEEEGTEEGAEGAAAPEGGEAAPEGDAPAAKAKEESAES